MKNKKLIFTFISIVVHLFLIGYFAFTFLTDSAIWIAVISSFTAAIGVYTVSNIKQKEIVSKYYMKELDGK